MNYVILSGRLTRDPEVRYTNSKKAVCSFSVAVRESKEAVSFHNCVAWEKTAELLDEYFSKGDGITLWGRLQNRQYEKDGQKRTVTEILVNGFEFPLTRRDEAAKPNAFEELAGDDEDLPL